MLTIDDLVTHLHALLLPQSVVSFESLLTLANKLQQVVSHLQQKANHAASPVLITSAGLSSSSGPEPPDVEHLTAAVATTQTANKIQSSGKRTRRLGNQ